MNFVEKKQKRVLTDTVFLFLTGAFLGWGYEVVLFVFKDGMFINRGMMHGPWLPIYGIGCVLMLWLKALVGNRPVSYFFASVAACGVLEYGSSWLSETVYHVRWWDYSECPLNLNGRIFLGGLLGFGAAGCLFAFLLYPVLHRQYDKLPKKWKHYAAAFLVTVFLTDFILSLFFPNTGFGITD